MLDFLIERSKIFKKHKKNKKASFPVIGTILILFVASFVLIYFAFMIFSNQTLEINDNKLQAQLITTNIIQNNCFFNEFGFLDKEKLKDENQLKNCLGDIGDSSFSIKVQSSFTNPIYLNKIDFEKNENKCSLRGVNIECFYQRFPVKYKYKGEVLDKILYVNIILN